jgi:hypothetical protein
VEGVVVEDLDGEDYFDEYNVTVTVSDGFLTIQMGPGANNAKICFIEIAPASGGPVEILENASFELPGTDKQLGFDDVPGWSTDGPVANSGVELDESASDGEWSAYLMSGDPSIWQLTDLTLTDGELVELTVDARISSAATTLQMNIYYDVFGTRWVIATQDVTLTEDMAEYTLSYEAVDVVAGANVGVELLNVSEGESWISVDNVSLSVSN